LYLLKYTDTNNRINNKAQETEAVCKNVLYKTILYRKILPFNSIIEYGNFTAYIVLYWLK